MFGSLSCGATERTPVQDRISTSQATSIHASDGGIRILVEPGSEGAANEYYSRVSKELGLGGRTPIGRQTMSDILEFCGYKGFEPSDIESLDSRTLMDYSKLREKVSNKKPFQSKFDRSPFLANDVIASRFFAPKISDVSASGKPISYGWRKIVRLRVRNNSLAQRKGIESLYLLFNVFQDANKIDENPFDNRSKNNQAILTRKPNATLRDPIYWFVYGELPTGSLQTFLSAFPTLVIPNCRYKKLLRATRMC